MNKDNTIKRFRKETYPMLGKARDATFALMESVMTTKNAYCLAELYLSPILEENGIVHTKQYRIVVRKEIN